MAYGYDGNMSALDWLALTGKDGVPNLREADKDSLRDSGILSPDNSIFQEQLDLALQYKNAEVTSRVQ